MKKLNKPEILSLLTNSDPTDLFSTADRIRFEYVGENVHLRALIEISNYCKNNCLYCGLRKDNKNLTRYRLTKSQILNSAKEAYDLGFKTIVMQGGEDSYFTPEILAEIIKEIKQYDIAITLSIGELETKAYEVLKDAGADRYLLRIETTDKGLYKKYNPDMSFENRVRCLHDLKKLGFEVGTGCLVGLPEQTITSLADDILFFLEIGADMIGIGPFIPNGDTPLTGVISGDFELSLRVMAITRLILPNINIPATTAMETLQPNGRFKALQCGANVIMPNITEGKYKELYKLYPGKFINKNTSAEYLIELKERLKEIGRVAV